MLITTLSSAKTSAPQGRGLVWARKTTCNMGSRVSHGKGKFLGAYRLIAQTYWWGPTQRVTKITISCELQITVQRNTVQNEDANVPHYKDVCDGDAGCRYCYCSNLFVDRYMSAKSSMPTHVDDVTVAAEKGKSFWDVQSRWRAFVFHGNDCISDIRSEWKEDVWKCRISERLNRAGKY